MLIDSADHYHVHISYVSAYLVIRTPRQKTVYLLTPTEYINVSDAC